MTSRAVGANLRGLAHDYVSNAPVRLSLVPDHLDPAPILQREQSSDLLE